MITSFLSDDLLDQVHQFHQKFVPEKIAPYSDKPAIGEDELDFRMDFLDEELDELTHALVDKDRAAELDAYIDICWVALGSALMRFGYSATACAMNEVFMANMAKVRVPGDFKIRKPEGWVGPDIEGALEQNKSTSN